MAFNLIPGGVDMPSLITAENQNILELKNQDVTKIFKDDHGTRVVVLDKNGLRTTAPGNGTDVMTATDSDFTFDSSRNTFRIVGDPLTVDFTLTTGATSSATTVTITHGLGYIPLTESSVQVTTNTYAPAQTGVFPLPYFTLVTGSGTLSNVFVMNAFVAVRKVTSSTIQYEIGMQGGTFTFAGTITCYIKQQTAT